MSLTTAQGFWKANSEGDDDSIDFLWIGDNGRIVHRIIYDHGGYVMRLWFEETGANACLVSLKPKSETHILKWSLDNEAFTLEHTDLKVQRTEFKRIEESDLPKFFVKDISWANRTMDTMERKA